MRMAILIALCLSRLFQLLLLQVFVGGLFDYRCYDSLSQGHHCQQATLGCLRKGREARAERASQETEGCSEAERKGREGAEESRGKEAKRGETQIEGGEEERKG